MDRLTRRAKHVLSFGLLAVASAASLVPAACGFPEFGGFAPEGQGGAGGTSGTGGQGPCAAGFAHCTSSATDVCETDIYGSVANCGSCRAACPKVNGTPSCNAGSCEIACDPGYFDCDKNVKNGCEIKTATDVDHCGACDKACPAKGGTPSCVAGKCGISTCDVGFGNCDGDATNGCETTFADDPLNCGGCGKACVVANGTPKCVGGNCVVDTCDKGFADCNGDYTDGCELATDADPNNCGACKNACTFKHATGVCQAGSCGMGDCDKGFADCNASPGDGCEISTDTDAKNCGACKTACASVHGLGLCALGACAFECQSGWAHCNPNPAFGCDTEVTQNLNNCGACDNVCSVANGSPSCQAKACGILACNLGFTDCDKQYATGCEAELVSDVNNCGSCGHVCTNPSGSTSCTGGLCTPSCAAGSASCDDNPDNGCEVSTKDDVSNCGGCGKVCGKQNTSASDCLNGSCKITCSPGFSDCNGNANDGCESSTSNDVANCGGCNVKCTNANGSTSCFNSVCTPTCNPGAKDCDSNPNNGCEANTKSDANNCGTCGTVCPANKPSCLNGQCFGDCPLDGYEPNATLWPPQNPPLDASQKKLDPVNNDFPVSGRQSSFSANFTNASDVDIYYVNVVDDLMNMKDVVFQITLSNIPAGATYSITAHYLCSAGDGQSMSIYNANPAQCPIGGANTGWLGSWYHCERDIPAANGYLVFGLGCQIGQQTIADTSGILEIEVKTVTPPNIPTCNPYSLTLQTLPTL